MDTLSGEALARYKDKLEVVGLSDFPPRSQHHYTVLLILVFTGSELDMGHF